MTEEQVTKAILSELIAKGWTIVAFDFPQSGTGVILHQDNSNNEKNKGSIIPDIVAVKNNICLFFENKDRVVISDFEKISNLIDNNQYSNAISNLLKNYTVNKIYYGIGLPSHKWNSTADKNKDLTDFIIGVNEDKSISFLFNPNGLIL